MYIHTPNARLFFRVFSRLYLSLPLVACWVKMACFILNQMLKKWSQKQNVVLMLLSLATSYRRVYLLWPTKNHGITVFAKNIVNNNDTIFLLPTKHHFFYSFIFLSSKLLFLLLFFISIFFICLSLLVIQINEDN